MKIFKLLFSRLFLLIILIIIQLAIINVVVYYAMNNQFIGVWCYLIFEIIELVFFISVINSRGVPEIRIAWISFILGLPLLGVVCFFFFSNRGLKHKTRKELDIISKHLMPYYEEQDKWSKSFATEDDHYLAPFKYVHNITWLPPREGNKVTYFKLGEEFFPDLINKLKEAEKFILMEFFIVDYGKEWTQIYNVLCDKAKSGVVVKFLYDDFGCASTLKRSFVKDMRAHGIECCRFNPFVPVLSGLFNNRDHRKICVIDHKYGYTGGINLADEYANDIVRFGYWKDSMIRIEGPAIKSLITLFCTTFDSSNHKVSNYHMLLDGEYPSCGKGFVAPFGDGPAPFCTENIGEQTIINLLASAKKTVYISSPYLIPTFCLTEALKNAAYRGIDVRIVVPGIPDKKIVYLMAKNNFKELLNAGVKIYTYTPGFNHEKEIIIDNKIAFIGTINLDYRSLVHHFECGALLYRTSAIQNMTDSFEDTISRSEQVPEDFKLPFIAKIFCSIAALFAPLM